MEAIAETIGHRENIVVVDVSVTGAKIRGACAIDAGQELLLRVNDSVIFAEAMWCDPASQECGLQFDPPLDGPTYAALKVESLKFSASTLSPDEYRALEDWRTGKAR